jgi:hypothetical protein
MSVESYKPTIWAKRALRHLENAHVYVKCVNREYEGEIRGMGSSVRINTVGDITIRDYVINTALTRENVHTTSQTLLVDQQKYFDYEVDEIDRKQAAAPNLIDDFLRRGMYQMAETMDDFLATTLTGSIATGNILTALTSVGTGVGDDDAYEALVNLRVKLLEANVPDNDLWTVIPPWFEGLLRQDARFVSFGTGESRRTIRGEAIGAIWGMTVHVSNNVPVAASAYDVIAGWKGACTYAEQMIEHEAYKPQDAFSDAIKHLQVYGAKVTRPSALAKVVCTQAT